MYIGRHASSVFDEKYFGSGKILKRAIKKYGENNFSIEILCEAESYEDLAEKERYYIALSDAVNRKDFYNIGRGGEGFLEKITQIMVKKARTLLGGGKCILINLKNICREYEKV